MAGSLPEERAERRVLCGSSFYEQKFYFNQRFDRLPQQVKDELKIMCVTVTEDVGGVLLLEFQEDGTLIFRVEQEEGDLLFDEIGSALLVGKLQREKRELLQMLELFYRTFFLEPNGE